MPWSPSVPPSGLTRSRTSSSPNGQAPAASPASGSTAAIDAPEAAAVEAALTATGWKLTDILVTLFEGVLRIDPAQPAWEQRDRFILSKGHCAAALYSVLASSGYFPPARLADFAAPLSPLNGTFPRPTILQPLYCFGLCDAVICAPPSRSSTATP